MRWTCFVSVLALFLAACGDDGPDAATLKRITELKTQYTAVLAQYRAAIDEANKVSQEVIPARNEWKRAERDGDAKAGELKAAFEAAQETAKTAREREDELRRQFEAIDYELKSLGVDMKKEKKKQKKSAAPTK